MRSGFNLAAEADTRIDLARAAPFVLGPLKVNPPTLEVTNRDQRELLEPRIMQVFVVLSRRRGEVVSRSALITECWDGRSVGDDAITRCVARLRRLAKAQGGFVIETIPRVGYRLKEIEPAAVSPNEPVPVATQPGEDRAEEAPVVPAPGPAATPAPTAAPTPVPAPAPTSALPAAAPRSGTPWWRSWRVFAAVAAILIAAGAADYFLTRPAPLDRVAVLPLQPLGPEEDARVFGAAVTEQIVGVLNENQVQAVAQGEVAILRGPGRDDAAEKLGADFVLDGTVQHTPGGLKVTVHLDRASSHTTLWTGTFDQDGLDTAGLQSQVAARVVDEIKGALLAAVLKDDVAVAAFLKAKEYSREGGREAALLRRDQMRIVVNQAPDFSLGHSGLAWSSATMAQYALDSEIAGLRSEAEREAARALELDPHNGEAYLALAALAPPLDYAAGERLFRKGLSVQPDEPTLNSTLAALMEDVGRISEAVALHERAVMLDPLSPRKRASYAESLLLAGKLSQARLTIARAAKQWPTNPNVWGVRFYVETYNDIAKARALLWQGRTIAPVLEPDFFSAVDAALTAIEHSTPQTRATARDAVLAAVVKRHLNDDAGIEILARIGEVDAAYALIEHAFFTDRPMYRYVRPNVAVLFEPSTAALRRDGRFLKLVKRLDLVKYWKEHTAPDFCRTETVAPCPDLRQQAH